VFLIVASFFYATNDQCIENSFGWIVGKKKLMDRCFKRIYYLFGNLKFENFERSLPVWLAFLIGEDLHDFGCRLGRCYPWLKAAKQTNCCTTILLLILFD
jgi:hypothetical protein